jgi:hypothetical protein
MKHHIAKAKEMFDAKIVYNVVIGILLTMFIIKVLAMVGWALGMGKHRGMKGDMRMDGRPVQMLPEQR